jgi:6-phosphogluconate dehydrogenase
MGANMVRRLMRGGHECVVYDMNPGAVADIAREGATGVTSLAAMAETLTAPRVVWIMLPIAVVDDTIATLRPALNRDDVIVDGGNSYFADAVRRAAELKTAGIHYLDVGTSGGVWGLERGYCQMIGGERAIAERLDPIFRTLAPSTDSVPPTPGRGDEGTAAHGYLYCGPSGAGHFVKMIHNGIEYGIMASYAEGLNILRHAGDYQFNLADITESWRRGSVIGSWLLDLTASALLGDAALDSHSARVSDSGEGRWAVKAAIDEGVPAPVLSAALYERFQSQGQGEFAARVLSAMRYAFGGHQEHRR